MHSTFSIFFLPLLSLPVLAVTPACVDGVHNKFFVESVKENLPVMLNGLEVYLYDGKYKPACVDGKPNVALPGYAKLSKGNVVVPKLYDLKNNTVVKMSARNKDGSEYCREGHAAEWFMPDRYCQLDLCDFVGDDFCEVVQTPGVHTLQELVEKIDFNVTLKLPPPPCLLMICATDIFAGDWEIEFFMEYRGKRIMHWKVPSRAHFLQIAVDTDDDEDVEA